MESGAAEARAATPRSFTFGDVLLQVEAVADGVVRVRRSRGATPESPSPAVLPDRGGPDARWAVRDGRLSLHAGALSVELDSRGLLSFRDAAGVVILREQEVRVSSGGAQRLVFASLPGEQYYGLGQKVRGPDDTSLRWNGRQRTFGPLGNAREKTCPVPGQGNGNTTIPLLHSSAGFGLFLDNHYRHTWDFTDAGRWSVEADQGEHRYYVFLGPDAGAVLARYTALTGRPPMPPRWALGLLQSRFGYRSWDEVEETARRLRAAGIPADAIILDLYWFGGVPHFGGRRRIGSLEWDREAFAGARERIARLRTMGFRVMLIEEPYVDAELPVHREAAEDGHLATLPGGGPARLARWWGEGGIVDMTRAATRRWWWRRHLPLMEDGVAGWWMDLGEPDTYDESARYAGGAHPDVHNVYAMEWARALAEGHERDFPADRQFLLTRAGYAGIQRYGAAVWSNDVMTGFDWLAPQVATGLNIGLSGIPWWGTDVGGFIGPVASPELYVRWFQFGAFCPVFRPHGQDRPTAPFEFGPEAEAICRHYARLRYRLLPYLYTAAREAHDTGLPPMRPLTLAFPDDPVVGDLGAQYLFGPSLLVAPMLHEGTERNVYLPDGRWVDFHTGEVFTGPTWLRRYPAPLERLPLFVRAGAILPLGPEMEHTGERPLDELTLRIFPGVAPSYYTLYEDDGHSTGYLQGQSARTRISLRPHAGGFTLELAPLEGSYRGMTLHRDLTVELPCASPPGQLRAHGRLLPYGEGSPAWTYDAERRWLVIRLGMVPVREAVSVVVST